VTLLPVLVVAWGTAVVAILLRRWPRLATTIGLLGLVSTIVVVLAIRPGETLEIGGSTIVTTGYARLFLVLGAVVALLLAVVGLAAGTRRDAPAVSLGTLGAAALALGLSDAGIAVLASTIGGLLGVLVTLAPASARAGATVGIREVRAAVIAGALGYSAAALLGRSFEAATTAPGVLGLAFLGCGLAVAIRFGAVPFHLWAARLADAAPEVTLPALVVWGPSALAVVALAMVEGPAVASVSAGLGLERAVIVLVAVATVVLGTFAAAIQDELEHLLTYAIVADAGIVVLALATTDPAAWSPARTWILAFVVTRSALAAWAAAVRTAFYTGRIEDLRGWARRSPILGAAFVLVVVASVGVPGLAVFEARATLVGLTTDGPLTAVLLVAVIAPLAVYARLAAVGLARAAGGRGLVEGWRPRFSRLDLTAIRTWAGELWRMNRAPTAAIVSLTLAVLALATSAGAWDGPMLAGEPGPSPAVVVGSEPAVAP
jgi:NADH-quinone oxidoreductase subunit N